MDSNDDIYLIILYLIYITYKEKIKKKYSKKSINKIFSFLFHQKKVKLIHELIDKYKYEND